jgi:transposase-like protein
VAAGAGGPVQRWRCKECGRYYLASCRRRVVTPAERRIAARLLRQAVAPRVIARALEVSEQWVYLLRRRLRDDNPAGLREKAGAGF